MRSMLSSAFLVGPMGYGPLIMVGPIQTNVAANVAVEFEKLSSLLGLRETDAAELALSEWVKRNHDEAQKHLDMYSEKGITIIQPETVNIAVFQKAEIYSARQELRRLLDVLETTREATYRNEVQLELARALRLIRPVYATTRDVELERLLKEAEHHFDHREPSTTPP